MKRKFGFPGNVFCADLDTEHSINDAMAESP